MRQPTPSHAKRRPATPLQTALLCLLLLGAALAQGSGGPSFRYGAVYTRGLVLGPGEQPIYVEYKDDGAFGSEIGEAVGPYAHARVMSTPQYRAYLSRLDQLKNQYPGLEQVKRDAYTSGSYTTVNGDPIGERALAPSTLVAALMPADRRYSSDPQQLILLELPIDPQYRPQAGSRSLLLGEDGAMLWDSPFNIGYKTGYGQDASGNETAGDFSTTQEYYGPIAGAIVENAMSRTGTDEQGKFVLNYPLPPCPGFSYTLNLNLYTELHYKRFNPRGEAAAFPYYLKRDNLEICNGLGEVSLGNSLGAMMAQVAQRALSSTPAPVYERSFIVDLMVLAGQARLPEGVTVGAATRYDGGRAGLERVSQSEYDFDGDALADKAVLGRINTVTDPDTGTETQQFEALGADQNPEIQGVWLSSRHDLETLDITATLPDLTRLSDWSADFADRGLLSRITLEDLRHTDLYVFRESDGTLVTERHGLKESEVSDIFLGVSAESGTFHYTVDIVGALEGVMNDFGYTSGGQYEQWQVSGQMNPKFYQRRADHLRPGEQVRLIALNRATGYLGSLSTTLKAAGSGADNLEISFPIEDIVLGPPNLKIWAERTRKIEQGMTQGTVQEQAIGNEGAGLADDTLITLYSEWLDTDGSPLPEGLSDYGYTGRLAKVIAPNQLGAVAGTSESGNRLSQFAIKPGRQIQVIRLPETIEGAQHLYVQVSGEPISQQPDFSTSELLENGILQYRPDHYVPFKTPVYDEQSSLLQQQAYREAKAAFEAGDLATEPKKPEPFYRDVYRPEFQFSLYDLAMEEIRRTDAEGNSEDVLALEQPVISSTDQLIDLFYGLTIPQQDPLTPYSYDGDRELVFAVGEQEIKATIGANQQLSFDNLEHLSSLTPEDFLSVALYSNNDSANLLWEYAFEYLDIQAMVDSDERRDLDGKILISADEPEIEIVADLVGYANRAEDDKYDVTLRWGVNTPGGLAKYVEVDRELALFTNTLTTTRTAGDEFEVTAKLINSTNEQTSAKLNFKVVPGEASEIQLLDQSGTAYVNKTGSVTIQVAVRDAHGNLVDDNTPIKLATEGAVEFITTPQNLTNGELSVELAGTDFAEMAKLVITAGEIVREFPIEIRPLTVAIQNLPTQFDVNTIRVGTVLVTDDDGQPVSGITVDAYSELGRVAESQVTTNASGEATFTYVAPQRPGSGEIKMRVALQPATLHAFNVDYPAGRKPRIDTVEALLIGDQTQAGTYDYLRYDAAPISVAYQIDGQVVLRGNSNETVNVTLGDHYEPNRLMLAALWMNAVETDGSVKDEVGFLASTTENVTVAQGSPNNGGRSLYFNGSRLTIADATRIERADNVSFSVAIKPEQFGGSVLNLADGISLVLKSDGSLTLNATKTDATTTTVSSNPISLSDWHRIAGYIHNGQLTLWVDGVAYTEVLSGSIQYSATAISDLVVGEGLTGQISGLKWFALDSGPLVTFSDGQETASVTLGATGEASVQVISTGSLQSFSSHLPMQSVAVRSAGERQTLNLISLEVFGNLSRIAIAGELVASAPAIDEAQFASTYAGQSASQTALLYAVDTLFPRAYAYDIGFWDVASIIGSLIGLDSLQVIWDQIGNMAMGRDVDIVSFSIAVLDVLTLFPPAAPLKIVLTPAKVAIKVLRLANPKAARYLGGVIKKLYNKAKDRDFSLVFQGIAFFIVAADMMSDPEAREGLMALAETINSTEDFLTWVEYFSLADPEILADMLAYAEQPSTTIAMPFTGLIPEAHASLPPLFGRAMGRAFKEMGPVLKELGSNASTALKKLVEVAKDKAPINAAKVARVRKVMFNKEFVKGFLYVTKRGGVTKLRNWLLGYNGQRIPPLALIMTAFYVEEEIAAGRLFPDTQDSFDRERNMRELTKLFIEAVPAVFTDRDIAMAHGKSFHLLQLALFHALSEANTPGIGKVKGIEAYRNVPVFRSVTSARRKQWENTENFTRKVDIVLEGANNEESWWELKSWKAKSKTNRAPAQSTKTWTFLQGRDDQNGNVIVQLADDDAENSGEGHKQFCLDRIAEKNGARYSKKEAAARGVEQSNLPNRVPLIHVSNFNWQFHKFSVGTKISPTGSKLEEMFVKNPRGDVNTFKLQRVGDTASKGRINLGATEQLMEILKQSGFALAEEALSDIIVVTE